MASQKKILVIGGGFSGIGSIKSLKEEGFEPVCYEKTSHAGGTWYYREETPMGIPSIMPTTIINHSKEMGALSNFPPDPRYPNYMRHFELLRLFTEIGDKFDVFRHIVYNREVTRVRRAADYDAFGRWDVTVRNTETGEVAEETFDGVLVGVGHITYPKMPDYPGLEKFGGKVMHTHSLKRPDEFRDKKVLVVGIGCSGLDAAVEISNVASQVYLSTRNGSWILPRVGPYGLPFDFAMLRRFVYAIQSAVGYKYLSKYLENYQLNTKFNHNLYNLRPAYHALSKDPATNDYLAAKLLSGSIVLRRDIRRFTERGVVFENEEAQETEVDAVVMATGYKWQFPFLEEGVVTTEKDGRINLYKCVYPPHLKHPTLAIIGFILPFGPGFPLGEMQCRWVTQVLAGHCSLPGREAMLEDIRRRHEDNLRRYAPSDKMTVRVEYIPYMDEIAEQIGCKPNLWKMLFTDFTLWKALVFGPSLPYQYRLEGPHKWEEARHTILTASERMRYPLVEGSKTKKPIKRTFTTGQWVKCVVLLLLVALWFTQAEASVKTYLLALVFPYFMTWRGFYKRFFFSLLMIPFYVTWEGFVASYFLTIFAPILIAAVATVP